MNDRWLGPWQLWVFAFWFILAIAVLSDAPCHDEPGRYATEQTR